MSGVMLALMNTFTFCARLGYPLPPSSVKNTSLYYVMILQQALPSLLLAIYNCKNPSYLNAVSLKLWLKKIKELAYSK